MDFNLSETQDIGHGVLIQVFHVEGALEGIGGSHPLPNGERCVFWIPVSREPKSHAWTLESETPLTVSPSLLCRVCGHHGFIRNGQWVPA